jgi:GT2 family glycosyltransferase
LVEGLRKRGVEAYGLDVSEFAIQNVHEDINKYCWVGSVTKPFPQKYDLIVSIEVLEHMTQSEAEKALENICLHTDDVLFSSTPFDYKEASHFNVQPPEYWSEKFALLGFYRDIDFDASFITTWGGRFLHKLEPSHRIVRDYERKFWLLWKENTDLRELTLEMRSDLSSNEQRNQNLEGQVHNLEGQVQDFHKQIIEKDLKLQNLHAQLTDILNSRGWRLMKKFQSLRLHVIPLDSRRERLVFGFFWSLNRLLSEGVFTDLSHHYLSRSRPARHIIPWRKYKYGSPIQIVNIDTFKPKPSVQPHQTSVDIIICVHNAKDDVKRCLEAIIRSTFAPYSLILIDDGSDNETKEYLIEFAQSQGATLIRNENSFGYTRAANQGLHQSSGEYSVLLNSDTIVSRGWLDRMIACAESDTKIGLIGPLSNTASWQSVPEIFNHDGDWAVNPLPEGMNVDELAGLVDKYSSRLYPRIPFLNGFCIMLKREVINQIGYLNEGVFGEGYGEENDYCLRAQKSSFKLAVSDDSYIYHAQSRSYSHERRKNLVERADKALVDLYGHDKISRCVHICRYDRVLQGIRARNQIIMPREKAIKKGRNHWEGKRILYLLPIFEPGGGGHVIWQEAKAMQKMGVDIRILNLQTHKNAFTRNFPNLESYTIYIEEPEQAYEILEKFDAVVASVFHSIYWMKNPTGTSHSPIRGYYIQDFEPDFFPKESENYKAALDSYTYYPDLVRMTKTEWNRNIIKERMGIDCSVIGPSIDIDLFRPRNRNNPDWPDRPLRIATMVRPSTPRRAPDMTMRVLRELSKIHGKSIEIFVFGCPPDDPKFLDLATDFPFKHAGVLTRPQIASLLNDIEIFADFSVFQAMGLTAMEAMSCGAAVVVPKEGGAESFARHEVNSLVIDTCSEEACLTAMDRLVRDGQLRNRIQQKAIGDICQYFPEKAALKILGTLFPSKSN